MNCLGMYAICLWRGGIGFLASSAVRRLCFEVQAVVVGATSRRAQRTSCFVLSPEPGSYEMIFMPDTGTRIALKIKQIISYHGLLMTLC